MTASQITYITRPDTITVMRNPDWTLNATSDKPFVVVMNVTELPTFISTAPRPFATYEEAMDLAQMYEIELHTRFHIFVDVVVEPGIDPELDEWLS